MSMWTRVLDFILQRMRMVLERYTKWSVVYQYCLRVYKLTNGFDPTPITIIPRSRPLGGGLAER